jgi:hypothetical protein
MAKHPLTVRLSDELFSKLEAHATNGLTKTDVVVEALTRYFNEHPVTLTERLNRIERRLDALELRG